jgi:spectrin beta
MTILWSLYLRSEAIGVRQSQIDKLYAGLKDLASERRAKLEEALQLFTLHREVDDLEQWIAEREVVAGSHELGQDYEHVTVRELAIAALEKRIGRRLVFFSFMLDAELTCDDFVARQMLRDRFTQFANDTEDTGRERVSGVNEIADELIAAGHSDAATIAEWKDSLNEAWADLKELIETRKQVRRKTYRGIQTLDYRYEDGCFLLIFFFVRAYNVKMLNAVSLLVVQ